MNSIQKWAWASLRRGTPKVASGATFCRIAAGVFAAGIGLMVVGCQLTSNSKTTEVVAPTADTSLVDNPMPVVVCDFHFDVAHLKTDEGMTSGREGPARRLVANVRPGETPAEKAARLSGLFSKAIAEELATLKIPAMVQSKDSPWPATGLLVRGEFLEVDEGNRLRRAVIGFGAGATEALAQVEVFDLRHNRDKPVLVFGAGTGSKPTPGGIVSMNPYAMAAKYVLSRNASEKDVRKLGKQIGRDLAQLDVKLTGGNSD